MKNLIPYKLFESDDPYTSLRKYHGDRVIDECDEHISVIKDMLLELSDRDYTCKVGYVMRDIAMKISSKPVIDIRLYNSDDEKMDFDAVILDVLRYGVSEGYKYKCEEVKSNINGEVIRYSIYLYKEETKKMPDWYNK